MENVLSSITGIARISISVVAGICVTATTAMVVMVGHIVFWAVQRCVSFSKTATRMWFGRWREQIQREWHRIKVFARVCIVVVWCFELFRYTSTQRLYQHIHSTIQFYDGKQAKCDVDSNGCCKSVISAMMMVVIATIITITVARIAVRRMTMRRIFQFCG